MTYSLNLEPNQIEDLLEKLGINVSYSTANEFVAYCPFHANHDSPALNVSKESGLWKCWNGSCGAQGNLQGLMVRLGYTGPEAERMIRKRLVERSDFEEYLRSLLYEDTDTKSKWTLDDLYGFREQDAEYDYIAKRYLAERNIHEDAYDYFMMGFSARKRMLTIPVIDEFSEPMGIIGRSVDHKQYQYSSGLERSETLWNIQNAKDHTSVILTEGALDSVYIWQAGFPSVCAVFGSSISKPQWRLIHKHFDTIYCFFDNDEPGKALTNSIIESQRDLDIQVVTYPSELIEDLDKSGARFKRPIKDPGELTKQQIEHMLQNAKSGLHSIFAL